MMARKKLGNRIFHLSSVDSTNDYAKSIIIDESDAAVDGTVIIASEQTKGKGRLGRSWHSPRRGIYLSLIIRQDSPENVPLLGVLSALPVAKALHYFDFKCGIKWPNDLLIGNKKFGGMLGELVVHENKFFAVVGIGVNSNVRITEFPEELRENATSLKDEKGRDVANPRIIEKILEEYAAFYSAWEDNLAKDLLEEYKALGVVLGKQVTVKGREETLTGPALDISEDGSLLIQVGDIPRKVVEGDVLECTVLN
jgi:BirA family biotin operon repressor/biotin-[acetyl-CoA-carboxylase] ligase